jgi:hypothetical protein|tara:strand:- start:3057 stop:3272 length:216 start_codon:yes stop_codon:yes gene_type:complete
MELNWNDGTTTKIVDGEILTVSNITQDQLLRKEIRELEEKLLYATKHSDGFEQMAIYQEIDKRKSILINIK